MGRGEPPRYGHQHILVAAGPFLAGCAIDKTGVRMYSGRKFDSRALSPGLAARQSGLCPFRGRPGAALEKNGSCRAISTARLERITAIPPAAYQRGRLPRPFGIAAWSIHLGAGFALRCFQRLSVPNIATRRCTWRHNRYTRGSSISVLSY